jgi:RNA polymerase sigma factor (sigma-70 family)
METSDILEQAAAKRQQRFITLYKKAFPAAARYISKMGGSFDGAKDVFQDALVIYYEKAIAGSARPNDEKAYILGIVKHLWIRKFNRDCKNTPLDDTDLADSLAEQEDDRLSAKLMQFVERTGKRCIELLRSFYYEKLPMAEVAQQFGYASTHSATVQKYKCLEKVREQIKEKALTYEDFFE